MLWRRRFALGTRMMLLLDFHAAMIELQLRPIRTRAISILLIAP